MPIISKPKVVVLGSMSKMPIAGIVFITLQYVMGLKRLGFDVHYVEAHARTPSWLMKDPQDDPSLLAASFIADMMRRFDLGDDRWAFHALHDRGQCYGMSEEALRRVYREAALIFNLHGGTVPRPEHYETNRLVYVGTDPVADEVAVHHGVQKTIDHLAPHCAFFTWGENHGNADCGVPTSDRFPLVPTRQPIVMDLWEPYHRGPATTFTTIASWNQPWRPVTLNGETYYWSKHLEFLKFLDLPRRRDQDFELALSALGDEDRQRLLENGWQLRESLDFTMDVDAYRAYIGQSRGEFTVAKDQNIRLRSGWFSDRSASYLACGRPVITQETGFSNILPTGEGLFAFSTMGEIEDAVDRINSDYGRQSRAAARIARECFDYRVVLGGMLDHLGCNPSLQPSSRKRGEEAARGIPDDLVLTPIARWPTTLEEASMRTVLDAPLERRVDVREQERDVAPQVSIVIVTLDGLVFTRLCLESLLAVPTSIAFEAIVVDNGSSDGTVAYLGELAARDARVRVICNGRNAGFAGATNQGAATARGAIVVLLNNDTIVTAGWLERIAGHLADERIGLLGAVTNRAGNEAEIAVSYRTYGELREFARRHMEVRAGERFDIRTVTMFCAAMRRGVLEAIGPLDERFEIGLFEDDDYAMRMRQAGFRVVCAEDLFVHHFGQASIGRLGPTGQYGTLFHANRTRWEEKWGVAWQPYERREKPAYRDLVGRIRQLVLDAVPAGARIAVISKGDAELLRLDGHQAWHFPEAEDGSYAGHYPANSEACIAELERLRAKGAEYLVIPETARWWLQHYAQFGEHLHTHYGAIADEPSPATIVALNETRMGLWKATAN